MKLLALALVLGMLIACCYSFSVPSIPSVLFSNLNRNNVVKNTRSFFALYASMRTIIDKLDDACLVCVRASKQRYSSGSEYYSNPKSQMGSWIDENYRNDVIEVLDDVCLNQTSELYKKTLQDFSDFPFCTDIFHSSSQYSLTLFHVPSYTHVPFYSHEAGTFLAYKTLYGDAILQTNFSSTANRVDILSPNEVTVRIGGPSRSFINNASRVCGVLELAIYPPIVKLEGTFDNEVKTPSFLNPSELVFNLLSQPYITVDEPLSTAESESFPATSFAEPLRALFASFRELQENLVDLNARVTGNTPETKLQGTGSVTKTVSSNRMPRDSRRLNQQFDATAPDPYSDIPGFLKRSIGGMGSQVSDIARRLLYSRRLPLEALEALGISHVSGLLLYGEPGTGKTLLARQLSAILTPIEPKIVNGPEILDKYVGEAERNARELFREADEDWERFGYQSNLHVIVFDEFDSIAKRRGSLGGDGSGVRDSVVNQLLSKMDGIRQRNNLLVIAITNRRDLIDPALLRPGRLEVQIEVPTPNYVGRLEILEILFRPWVEKRLLRKEDSEMWAERVAARTHGWTGADLAGLVRSAVSFLTERYFESTFDPSHSTTEFNEVSSDSEESESNVLGNVRFEWRDIDRALRETTTDKRLSLRKRVVNYASRTARSFLKLFRRRNR